MTNSISEKNKRLETFLNIWNSEVCLSSSRKLYPDKKVRHSNVVTHTTVRLWIIQYGRQLQKQLLQTHICKLELICIWKTRLIQDKVINITHHSLHVSKMTYDLLVQCVGVLSLPSYIHKSITLTHRFKNLDNQYALKHHPQFILSGLDFTKS